MSRVVSAAGGVFAPGHLGELTQIVPFEMVDAVLEQTRRVQKRVRLLPARVVVYLLLAAALFQTVGYLGVWRKLTAGLDGLPGLRSPSGSAICQALRRVGAAPLKALFELLRGPATAIATPGAKWRGLLVCAIDGTTLSVPDTFGLGRCFGKQKKQDHPDGERQAGYPSLRLLVLVACGTRAVIDAVFGPKSAGETTYAKALMGRLHAEMIVLLDRNFGANAFLASITATSAQFLLRLKGNRKTPVLARYGDGSYASIIGGIKVRVIECEITIATTAGSRTETYRLATTLLDHHRYPASELITLYHQRWEIETAYLELKHTILGGSLLRATTPEGITQEIYALLVAYQVLRIAITDTTLATHTDPDRASFTIALQTARDQIILAAGIIADTTIDLQGTIGRHILANILPTRRLRLSPRIVKRPLSRYAATKGIDRNTYKATLTITICTGQTPLTPGTGG